LGSENWELGSEKWEVRKDICRTVVILLVGLLGAVAPAHDASGQNFFMILGKMGSEKWEVRSGK